VRRRFVVVGVLAMVGALLQIAPAIAGSEGSFVAKMNAERTARGLAPLRVYGDLVDDARAQSQRMMADGNLFHNPALGSVTSGWIALGENIGSGASVDAIHAAFMASATHRGNILGDFNYVGVGVAVESADRMWVTVVFMKGADDLLDGGGTTTTTTTTTVPEPVVGTPSAEPVANEVAAATAPSTQTALRRAPVPRHRPIEAAALPLGVHVI